MPEACKQIRKYLNLGEPTWEYIQPKSGIKLEVEALFERM